MLSTCVQHHPSRADLLTALDGLGAFELVVDPEPDAFPSAIRTYLECLRRTPPDATHRLIVQDDTIATSNFCAKAEAAITERPDQLLAFFVPNRALHGTFMRNAAKAGQRWCTLPTSTNWQPTVALCWPVEMAADFLPFAEEHVARRLARGMSTQGDDPVVGSYVRARGLLIAATVPCLIEHPDVGYSLVKRREYKGQNRARSAAVFDP